MYTLFNWVEKNKLIVYALIILSVGMMVVYIYQNIRLDSDITKLVSFSDRKLKKQMELISHIGSIEQILIDISLKNNSVNTPNQLINIKKVLVNELMKSGHFEKIFHQLNTKQFIKLEQTFFNKRFFLIEPSSLNSQKFLDEKYIQNRLQIIESKLSSFESIVTKRYLLGDPFGLFESSIHRIMNQNISYSIQIKHNHLFSKDLKHLLVITKPQYKAFDIDKNVLLLKDLQNIIQKMSYQNKDINIKILGGAVYSVNSAKLIRKDISTILIISILSILLLYILSFRSPKVLILSILPVFVGIITGIFVLSLFYKSIHGITLVFGTSLIGICIDYTTHFFSSYLFNNSQDNKERRQKALRGILKSLLFGYLTTVLAFIIFNFSNLRILKEIAIYSCFGITVAFLISVLIVPQFVISQKMRPSKLLVSYSELFMRFLYPQKTFRNFLLAIVIFIIIASVFIISDTKINNRISDFNYIPREVKDIESEIFTRYGDISSNHIIISAGSTLQHSLQLNDKVYKVLQHAKKNNIIQNYFNISPFFPSINKQKQIVSKILSVDWDVIKNNFIKVGQKSGFKINAFDSFFKEVNQLKYYYNYINTKDIQNSPFSSYLNEVYKKSKKQHIIISYFKAKNNHNISNLIQNIQNLDNNIYYINRSNLFNQIVEILNKEIIFFILISLLATGIFLILLYKDIKKSIIAFLPSILGIITMLSTITLLNLNINIISLFALVLIIGIGVDYGIFVVNSYISGWDNHTPLSVSIAAVTTILSFGILIISGNKALFTIGLVTFLGILYTLIYSLTLTPILCSMFIKRGIDG